MKINKNNEDDDDDKKKCSYRIDVEIGLVFFFKTVIAYEAWWRSGKNVSYSFKRREIAGSNPSVGDAILGFKFGFNVALKIDRLKPFIVGLELTSLFVE